MTCTVRDKPIFSRGRPGDWYREWSTIVVVGSLVLLLQSLSLGGEPFASPWIPTDTCWDSLAMSHNIGTGAWISDSFDTTSRRPATAPPPPRSFALLTVDDVFPEDQDAWDDLAVWDHSSPGPASPDSRTASQAHPQQPYPHQPQQFPKHHPPSHLATSQPAPRSAPRHARPGVPSDRGYSDRGYSDHSLGHAWHSRFAIEPSASLFSTRFADGHPVELGPQGWAWSQREGSLALGERLELVGQTLDLRGSHWLDDPRIARDLDLRGDTVLPRVGFQYEIMPDQVIGYYAYEQSALGSHGDDFLFGTSDYLPLLGENHRAGVQTRSSDGRWELVASGFYSEMDLNDALFASPRFSRSVGAILAVNARVSRRWNTTFQVSGIESYGLSTDEEEGWRIPRKESNSSLSIWNRIRIWEDSDQNLTLGLGTRLVSNYKNSYADSMLLPGYSRWDVGLFYRRRGLDARIYVESILDAGYYEGADHLLNNPDSPLAVEAKVQLRY